MRTRSALTYSRSGAVAVLPLAFLTVTYLLIAGGFFYAARGHQRAQYDLLRAACQQEAIALAMMIDPVEHARADTSQHPEVMRLNRLFNTVSAGDNRKVIYSVRKERERVVFVSTPTNQFQADFNPTKPGLQETFQHGKPVTMGPMEEGGKHWMICMVPVPYYPHLRDNPVGQALIYNLDVQSEVMQWRDRWATLWALAVGGTLLCILAISNLATRLRWMTREIADVRADLTLLDQQSEAVRSTARRVQRGILPRQAPSLIRGNFAIKFFAGGEGGDNYEFFPLGNDRVGLLLTRATGPSTAVAFLDLLLQRYFVENIRKSQTPGAMLQAAHDRVLPVIGREFSAGAFYADINTQLKTVRYAGCGYPPPIVIKKFDQQLQELAVDSRMLGASSTLDIHDHTINLHPGDKLLFFSNGLFDLKRDGSAEGERFGLLRLQQWVAENRMLEINDMVEIIYSEAVSWAGGEHHMKDDITLIGLELT